MKQALGKLFDRIGTAVSRLDASSFGKQEIRAVRGNWYWNDRNGEYACPIMVGRPENGDIKYYAAYLLQMRPALRDKPDYDPARPFAHGLASIESVKVNHLRADTLEDAVAEIKNMNAELEADGHHARVSERTAYINGELPDADDPLYQASRSLNTLHVFSAQKSEPAPEPVRIVATPVRQLRRAPA